MLPLHKTVNMTKRERSAQFNPVAFAQLDQHQFGKIIEPHRSELQAHCYRMLGSVQDAEDMVQETFLRAWRRRETYEGRASLRAWLYKIATNVCLDMLDKRPRRLVPLTRQNAANVDDPIPAAIQEPIWLEPYPDDLLPDDDLTPESHYTTRESITLAFIAALHLLPARQRSVLILRDVLDWQAAEVAEMLEMTIPAVKSALRRARVTLEQHYRGSALISRDELGEATKIQLTHYIRAWETADIDLLLTLLKDDASFSMPPIPSWYQGHEAIHKLISKTIFAGQARDRWRLYAAAANRQVAFGLYRLDETEHLYNAYGIQVLTFDGEFISDIITFRTPSLFAFFKLPLRL
jgi:RNA polymerase sigma-70 factor, ECF subfamily